MQPKRTKKKYLVIATEPWEIELGLKIFSETDLKKSNVKFLIADHYSFVYQQEFLDIQFSTFGFSYFTYEENYRKWQTKHKIDHLKNREYLRVWENQFCKERTMEQLKRTFQGIYGWEYNKFQYSIDNHQEEEIYAELLEFLTNLFNTEKFTNVVALSRRSFLSNAAHEYSKTMKIQMMTLIHTRIGNRWMFREDFGLGMSPGYFKQVQNIQLDKEALRYQLEMLQNKPLYQSLTHTYIDNIIQQKERPLSYFKSNFFGIIKRIISRFLNDSHSRKFPVRILGESQIKLAKTEIVTFINSFLLTFLSKVIFDEGPVLQNSFSWFLHARPEDSTLVLGLGMDEFEEIKKVSTAIGEETLLYVKENALMYGLRDWSFYLKLRLLKNVRIIRPDRPNFDLIQTPFGVLGLSGTILLEAKIQGKPAFAIGLPEFIGVLDNSNCSDYFEFIDFCRENLGKSDNLLSLKYVQWIHNVTQKENVAFLENLNSDRASKLAKFLASKLL